MPQAIPAALLFFTSLGVTGTALAIATYAGAALITLAPLGVSLLLGTQAQSAGVKPSQAQQEVKQPLAARRKSYGVVRISGILWWLETDPANPDYVYIGLALNQGRIGAFLTYHVDEAVVPRDPVTGALSLPYNGKSNHMAIRFGASTETASSEVATVFGQADARGDGVASLLASFQCFEHADRQLQSFPNGLPGVRATIQASVCYDPRNPAHVLDDETTWSWSENPVVIVLNYMLDPDGYGMPFARFSGNMAEWTAAMDACDAAIDLAAGGTEKRYRLAGTLELTARPRDIVAVMLSTCDGRVWQRRDGSIGVSVGVFAEPTVAIESRDILSYRMERGQDRLTAVAGLRAQFMSPDHDYKEYDADPWPSGATVLELDEDRVDTLDLTWVPSHSQARRLMKREFIRRMADWRGTVSTNLAGLRAMDERFVTIRIDELGIDQSFEVNRFTLDPATLRCQLDVQSIDAAIDDWSPDEEGTIS